MGAFLKDFLFPKTCFGCGQWGEYLCNHCLNKIKINQERRCPVCGKPAIGGKTHPICQKRYTLDGLTSIFSYSGLLKKILKKLKYRFVFDVSQELIELFLSCLGEDIVFSKIFSQNLQDSSLFIPVPLHLSRKRWRGFNQSELLGKMIAENLGINFVPNMLKRVKNTTPQTELKKKERQKNIKDAFKINEQFTHLSITHSPIILFDDVWTTGSTLRECAGVLKRNGARFIWGLTLAS